MVQGQWGTSFDPEKLIGQETKFCLLLRKTEGRFFRSGKLKKKN